MLNQAVLQDVIANYKHDFDLSQWENEKFKWQAVRHFQDHWDIEAEDFPGMLEQAMNKTYNLLVSVNYFPLAMIKGFAKAAPEEVRAAFRDLFDERRDVVDRIAQFKALADVFHEKYAKDANNHYQNENSISTYLWLRYPDKYYIYKYGETRKAAKVLVSDYSFKKGAYAANIRNAFAFYDELSMELQKDEELTSMLRSHLTDEEYPDAQCKTLAFDVSFYISRNYSEKEKTTYLTEIIESLKALGGNAHLSAIHAEMEKRDKLQSIHTNPTWKQTVSASLQSHCSDTKSYVEGNEDIFYSVDGLGKGMWGLRNYQSEDNEKWHPIDYSTGITVEKWLDLLKDPEIFTVDSLKIMKRMLDHGGMATCTQLTEKYGNSVNFYNSGSSYLAKRVAEKTGCPLITREDGSSWWWPILYLGKSAAQDEAGWFVWKLRDELKEALENFDLSDIPLYEEKVEPINPPDKYDRDDFLREVFMSGENFDTLKLLLEQKKNIILQGAPGVGKTYTARRLAYAMMGVRDDSRIELIQFHQNYSYEDFIMGYKPDGEGFRLAEGVFYRFCDQARNDSGRDYFFIIDEINRGNMSKIFGELLMLIEKDYRNTFLKLTYTDKPFTVPDNLYIIGMMNTADRSLALIDYALRRRFSFFEMAPGFDTEGFEAYQKALDNDTFDHLIQYVRELNHAISKDASLGDGFRIGHSYFSNWKECTDDKMKLVAYYEILPMLKEYWFDDKQKVQDWEIKLNGVFDD